MSEILCTLSYVSMTGLGVAGASTTTDTATAYKTDKDGEKVTESKIKPIGSIVSAVLPTATTATNIGQNAAHEKVMAEAAAAATTAYIESLTDAELAKLYDEVIGKAELPEVEITESNVKHL